jgi:hypothetical protein
MQKPIIKYLPMKHYFYPALLILFIGISVWLSYGVKQTNQALKKAEKELGLLSRENNRLQFQYEILHEAFELNFNLPPLHIDLGLPGMGDRLAVSTVLHLKPHACSPCNLPVLKALISHMRESHHFSIVSHPSNRHFLMQVLDDEFATAPGRLTWMDHNLYEGDNGYDAELIFIDYQNRKLGYIPLELLKDNSLFEKILAGAREEIYN